MAASCARYVSSTVSEMEDLGARSMVRCEGVLYHVLPLLSCLSAAGTVPRYPHGPAGGVLATAQPLKCCWVWEPPRGLNWPPWQLISPRQLKKAHLEADRPLPSNTPQCRSRSHSRRRSRSRGRSDHLCWRISASALEQQQRERVAIHSTTVGAQTLRLGNLPPDPCVSFGRTVVKHRSRTLRRTRHGVNRRLGPQLTTARIAQKHISLARSTANPPHIQTERSILQHLNQAPTCLSSHSLLSLPIMHSQL